nr:hypothetical protein [Tanacetum cinerariifolium]
MELATTAFMEMESHLHYPKIHPPSQDISDEVFQANHSVQYKENLENSSNSNQEKEGPPQDSDIRQLIREECCIEVCEEQKENMENNILELVKICRLKELLCMHDNVDDLIESALNSKLLSINSQRLDKEKQEVKKVVEQPTERETRIEKSLHNFRVIHKSSISLNNTSQISPVHAVAPILSTKEPEYSSSMGYEHPNTTSEMESDEIIKSGVEELVPVLTENEVTLEDKRECDELVCENSPICDDHSEIFSDSNNDDDISSDDDDFEDIEYVEASLPDPEIISLEEENDVHQEEEEEVDLEDISQIQDVILREKLLSINRLITNIESLNDNPTPDLVPNSSVSFPISEESDNSLSDNFSSEFKTFCDHSEETRSGKVVYVVKNDIYDDLTNDPLLKEADLFLATDNLIPSDADVEFETDSGEEILVVINDNDELECLNPRDEFDDDYSSFMIVICSNISLSFLFPESEDTIFDPAGSKDRPPMLAPGNYIQWKSRIKRYIDTKPNHDLIHFCLTNPPYELGWKEKAILDSEGNPTTTTQKVLETYKSVTQEIIDQLNAEAEAVQIILTEIDNDIYLTVDACPNACEIWKAIERLKQGESINVQDLETNLFWEFGKFTSLDGKSLESYYLRVAKICDTCEAKSRAEECLISQTL